MLRFDNARRNPNVLGVSAVVEQQILTKVFETALAVIAIEAGRGIGSHDSLADTKAFHVVPDRDDITRQFMTEQGRRNDHSRVISAPKYLDVGTAGERSPHADQNVAFSIWVRRPALLRRCSFP